MPTLNHESQTDLEQLARWQVDRRDRGALGSIFDQRPTLSVKQAYEVQRRTALLRQRRGERLVGYKVGCTCAVIRRQLGVDRPIFGRLFSTGVHSSGATLQISQYPGLAIEGELAVELSRDVPAGPCSQEELIACIARVFPVIELHNAEFAAGDGSAPLLIASNGIHAGFVRGTGCAWSDIVSEPSLVIGIGGRAIETIQGPALLENIIRALRWLAGALAEAGELLTAGQIVLTGSMAPLIRVNEPGRVTVDVSPIGGAHAQLIG